MKIAFRNVFRHWRKSLAAILLISSGFAAVNLFEGYIANIESVFDDMYSKRMMYGDFLLNRNDAFQNGLWDDGTHGLSADQQRKVESILRQSEQVGNFVRFLNGSGLVSNGMTTTTFLGVGYDIEAGERMRGRSWQWNTLAGSPLENAGSEDSAVIGQGLGKLVSCVPLQKSPAITTLGGYPKEERPFECVSPYLQLSVTSTSGQMNATSIHVKGIEDAVFSELDSRCVVIGLAKMQSLLNTKSVSFYSVALKENSRSSSAQEQFLGEMNQRFRSQNIPVTIQSWKAHAYGQIYKQSLGFLHVFRDFVLAVTLTIVILSVFSMLARLVEERTREIGTLRCLGYKPARIRLLFLSEALLISTLGNMIGAVFAIIGALGVNSIGFLYRVGILAEKIPFQIDLPVRNFAFGFVALTFLTGIAAAMAVERALRRKIPECLSHN